MEENTIGYLLNLHDDDTNRQVEGMLAENPELKAQVERLRQALEPLACDKDVDEPREDLIMATVALVAEHAVATDERIVETGVSPVAEFIRSLTERERTPPPVYPWHLSEANPPQTRRRDLAAFVGLTAAVLMIGIAGTLTLRQTWEVQACQNNMRALHQGLDDYCDRYDDRYPQVVADQDVRATLAEMKRACSLPKEATFTCPGVEHKANLPVIDYAYNLGYRDDQGQLVGLARSDKDRDQFPIFADAPERRNGQSVPVNHRKGQNVLFAGGHVRFCTHPNVGPEPNGHGDDIYFNVDREAHAGKFRWDTVLGRADDKP